MRKLFTRENAKQMAARSVEARNRNREQAGHLEASLVAELGNKPITRALLALLRERPKLLQQLAEGLVASAANGSVRAFKELADRVEGPVVQDLDASKPRVVVNVTLDRRPNPVFIPTESAVEVSPGLESKSLPRPKSQR